MVSPMDYSDDCSQYKMLQHAFLRAHAGINTLHRYYVSCTGYRFVNVFVSTQLESFKLAGFVFQSLAVVLAPPYPANDCRLVSLTERHLHSADIRTCVVPRTNTRFKDRSFSTSGPKIWNGLPSALRQPTGSGFAVFKRHLKSHSFNAI